MTARWRSVLRMRVLLQQLLDRHVPVASLADLVEQVKAMTDDALVDTGNRLPTLTASLARELVNAMLGDDVELIDRDRHPVRELLLRAARDELRLRLRQLHGAVPVHATEDGTRIEQLILRLDAELKGDSHPAV